MRGGDPAVTDQPGDLSMPRASVISASGERPTLAGVDGCPGGWIAAILHPDGGTRVERFAGHDPARLLARADIGIIVIDVPIGLPDRGSRQADLAARRLLGRPRASSVFPAPLRSMLGAVTADSALEIWSRAAAIGREVEGRACSRQLAAILPRIAAVDRRVTPVLQDRLVEGHPEVSFALLARRRGLRHQKRAPAGRTERLGLLRPHFPDILERLDGVAGGVGGDAVDAYALLWTARRLSGGEEMRLPEGSVQRDRRGLRGEIVA